MGLDALARTLFGNPILIDFAPENPEHASAARQLGRFLAEQAFTEREVSKRLGIASLQTMPPHRNLILSEHVLGDGKLDEIIRLFLLNTSFASTRMEALLPATLQKFLTQVGMLATTPNGQIMATVSIFPHAGLYLVTDAWAYSTVWGRAERHGDRVMYPGHDSTGLAYFASRSPVASTLDMCCGSGIQALLAADYSGEVVAVDINPRAIRMAEFNARLNGVGNVTFLTGDLFAPVQGKRFDAILANPPFVPCSSQSGDALLFRDGGVTGEAVLARILAGWTDHARAEGRLTIVSDFVNLADYPAKLDEWQNDKMETHLFIEEEMPLIEYAMNHSGYITDQHDLQKSALSMLKSMCAADVRTIHFGYLIQASDRRGRAHVHELNGLAARPSQVEAAQIMRSAELLAAASLPPGTTLQLSDGIEVAVSVVGAARRIRLDAQRSLAGSSCEISGLAYTLLERIDRVETTYRDLDPEEQALARDLAALNILHLA